eukprot:g1946.t1
MSSLSATQADGYYHPPSYNPRKHKSLKQFHGDRVAGAKHANQYLARGVVRFEMPHMIWCNNCGCNIMRGNRYNARKRKIGMYFTTPIYEFTMKCRNKDHQRFSDDGERIAIGCSQEFIIRTDPKNTDYEFISGCRRVASAGRILPMGKDKDGLSQHSNSEILIVDTEDRAKRDENPMQALEHREKDRDKKLSTKAYMSKLIENRTERSKYDQNLNKSIRRMVRKRRREEIALKVETMDMNLGLVVDTERDIVTKIQLTNSQSTPSERLEAVNAFRKRKHRIRTDKQKNKNNSSARKKKELFRIADTSFRSSLGKAFKSSKSKPNRKRRRKKKEGGG